MRPRTLLLLAALGLPFTTACRRARPVPIEGTWALDRALFVDAAVVAMRDACVLPKSGESAARAHLQGLHMEVDLLAGGKFTCRMGLGGEIKTYAGGWKGTRSDLKLDQTHEGDEPVRDTMTGSIDGDVLRLLHDEPGVRMPYVLRKQAGASAAPPR